MKLNNLKRCTFLSEENPWCRQSTCLDLHLALILKKIFRSVGVCFYLEGLLLLAIDLQCALKDKKTILKHFQSGFPRIKMADLMFKLRFFTSTETISLLGTGAEMMMMMMS